MRISTHRASLRILNPDIADDIRIIDTLAVARSKILLIEDKDDDADLVTRLYLREYDIVRIRYKLELVEALGKGHFDAAILDYKLVDFDGDEALRIFHEKAPQVPIIVCTETVGEDRVVDIFRRGATDFLRKDRLARLPEAIKQAIERKRMENSLMRVQRAENLGGLAAGISHDIRNCLAAPIMAIDMVAGYLPAEQRMILYKGRDGCKRAEELIQQLMDYVRGSNGGYDVVDLAKQLRDAVKLAQQGSPTSIQFETHMADLTFQVRGNAVELFQVALNLLMNSRDAMDKGGMVTVILDEVHVDGEMPANAHEPIRGDFVRIRVMDTGSGISPENLTHIWTPFWTSKPPGKGTGLGLSTVLKIIESHHGYVDVSSPPGMGATFTVLLPITDEEPAKPVEVIGHGEAILVVDDQLTFLELTRTMLEDANFKVYACSNGAEAMEVYAIHHADIAVALLDCAMPVMNGAELARKLRAVNPALKVVALSGLDAQSAEVESMKADQTLQKPFAPRELCQAIRALTYVP